MQNNDTALPAPLWDPLSPTELKTTSVPKEDVKAADALETRLQKRQRNPRTTLLITLLLFVLAIIAAYFIFTRITFSETSLGFAVACFLPAFLHGRSGNIADAESLYFANARLNNWLYDPWGAPPPIEDLYPPFFKQGDKRSMSDQFWGSLTDAHPGLAGYFWMTNVHYNSAYDRNTGKGIHDDTIYAFPLENSVANTDFAILAQQGHVPVGKHDIQTESDDFNKMFMICYEGDRDTAGKNIFQVLSPTMQDYLLKDQNDMTLTGFGFYKNVLLILVLGTIPVPKKGEVLGKQTTEKRAPTELEEQLQTAASIASAIAKQLPTSEKKVTLG